MNTYRTENKQRLNVSWVRQASFGQLDHISDHHIFDPAYDKTYNKTRATSEDSDQSAHLRGLNSLR